MHDFIWDLVNWIQNRANPRSHIVMLALKMSFKIQDKLNA